MIDSTEVFKEDLTRVVVRDKIAMELNQKKPVKKIISEIKSSSTRRAAEILASRLTTQENLIDEKTMKLIQELQKQVAEEFPELTNIALVPLGSTAHGGRKVREALGTSMDTDLDLGITCDQSDLADSSKFHDISSFISSKVQELAETFGFSSKYHLCGAISPRMYHSFNLDSLESALTALNYPNADDLRGDRIISYLLTSIPPQVNENNRIIALDALRYIHNEDPKLWRTYIEDILSEWSEHHKLKPKHLIGKETKDLYQIEYISDWTDSASASAQKLINRTTSESKIAMQNPLRQLLNKSRYIPDSEGVRNERRYAIKHHL